MGLFRWIKARTSTASIAKWVYKNHKEVKARFPDLGDREINLLILQKRAIKSHNQQGKIMLNKLLHEKTLSSLPKVCMNILEMENGLNKDVNVKQWQQSSEMINAELHRLGYKH